MALFRGRRARGRTKPSGGSPITSKKDGYEDPILARDAYEDPTGTEDGFEVPVFKGDDPKP